MKIARINLNVIVFAMMLCLSFLLGYSVREKNIQVDAPVQTNSNAVVWNKTALYTEPELRNDYVITTIDKGVNVVVEDVLCDFYFIRIERENEHNDVEIVYTGWALNKDIRLYADFSNRGFIE